MATLDSIEGIVSANNVMLQQVNGFPPGTPTAMRTIATSTLSGVNDITGGALGLGTINAKLDALSTLLQHVSDGIDTLLNTLNGGAIDTKIGIIITTTSDIQDKVEVLGVQGDDWNNGEHTIFGGLNAIGGTP